MKRPEEMSLAVVLKQFLHAKKRTLGKLAELTQQVDARAEKQNVAMKFRGVPKRTLGHWYNGDAKRPRAWEELVLVATALDLNETETNELLLSAKHRALAELRANETRADRLALLARWDSDAPFQLGPDLKFFAGRKMELAKLEDALLKQRAVTICGLRGMGGVGKTTLARHLAYRLQNQFPDGVLWGQLNRSDTLTILAQFAREYKLDVSAYRDVESRSRAVQSLLANKRVLIILDNAQTSDQVRPLLPPSTGKPAVMLTTRHDLAVSDEMTLFELRPFARDGQEALELFTNILDEQTVRREPRALLELAAALGYLPLALAIAANRLKQSPVGSKRERAVNEFLVRVRGNVSSAAARLDELTREDLSVRVTFDLSFAELSDTQQEFFIALGAFSGDDFDVSAAAYVAQVSLEQAKQFLNDLVSLSLVEIVREGRYALHRLMRDYAREKMVGTDAYARVLEYHVRLVQEYQQDEYNRVVSEVGNLASALQSAMEMGLVRAALDGIKTCLLYLLGVGLHDLVEKIFCYALDRNLAHDQREQFDLLYGLGRTLAEKGKRVQARVYFDQALALTQELEDPIARVDALRGILLIWQEQDDAPIALYEEAIALARASEYHHALLSLMNNLAGYCARYDIQQARELFERALELSEQYQNTGMTLALLSNLSDISMRTGEWEQAKNYLARLERELTHSPAPFARVRYLNNAGEMALSNGELESARNFFQQNLEIAGAFGENGYLALTYSGLGEAAWREGHAMQAESHLARATQLMDDGTETQDWLIVTLRCAEFALSQNDLVRAEKLFADTATESRRTEWKADEAAALFGLARVHFNRKEFVQAKQAALESHQLFVELGHYRAVQVHAWLHDLDAISDAKK